jgi:hypothetical protein
MAAGIVDAVLSRHSPYAAGSNRTCGSLELVASADRRVGVTKRKPRAPIFRLDAIERQGCRRQERRCRPTARQGTGPLGPTPTRRPAADLPAGRLVSGDWRRLVAYATPAAASGGPTRFASLSAGTGARPRPPRLGRRRVAPRSQQIAQRAFRRTWFDEALAPNRTIHGANPTRRICEQRRRHRPHDWSTVRFVEAAMGSASQRGGST